MKGIIIYENDLGAINAAKLKNASFCYESIGNDITDTLKGRPVTCISAKCSPEDTYDFETGALIALMKMCGREKVKKAAKETFFEVAENSVNEYEEKIHALEKENEKLQHEYDLCMNSENALKITTQLQNKSIEKLTKAIDDYKNDLYKVAKRCRELEAKEAILNKQEETINKREEKISVYFGGRGCEKQYKALVELFKKIDQKKVDAAYKEAYNTALPVWQKEVINQMYGVYKESKDKPVQIKGFIINIKPSIKRAEMWNDILACDCEHSKYVKVKKEDLETFAKECNEKKIFNVIGYEFHTQEFWFADDSCIFQIFRKPAGFICAKRVGFVFKDTVIDYLPPMRWDLFEKGRLAVKVTYNNCKEFCDACERELGKKPSTYLWGNVAISICKKDGCFEIFTIEHQKKTGRKIVNWEDVR